MEELLKYLAIKCSALVIQPEHPEPGTNIIISVESRLKVLFCNA